MVKVKICGITNESDAQAAVEAGVDALGFVFYPQSPRYVTPDRAASIIKSLPRKTIVVGVFVNARVKTVVEIAKHCHLDMVQLHGEESAEFCEELKNFKLIKAFRVKGDIDWPGILQYRTCAYLFDKHRLGKKGGTGLCFDWGLLRDRLAVNQMIFLSGGLNAGNLKRAIQTVRPDWVDVSSGVESSPGKKDTGKVKQFIRLARKT